MPAHLPGHTNQTFLFKPLPDHPWVLSTDMHYTQGAMDLSEVRHDAAAGRLSETARRRPGGRGTGMVFVPAGFQAAGASDPLHHHELNFRRALEPAPNPLHQGG